MNVIKPLDPHVGNILAVYSQADRQDKYQGMNAYQDYHMVMRGLYHLYCEDENNPEWTSLNVICGVFAALSPNATYSSNLSSAASLISTFNNGLDMNKAKVSTYRKNKIKAWAMLTTGSVAGLLKAKKTTAFYKNISSPNNPDNPVVVDGHIYSVWSLKQFRMNEAKVGNGKRYDRIAGDVITAARIAGILPSQMQAVCWFTWKRVNRISFDVKELQPKLWID